MKIIDGFWEDEVSYGNWEFGWEIVLREWRLGIGIEIYPLYFAIRASFGPLFLRAIHKLSPSRCRQLPPH